MSEFRTVVAVIIMILCGVAGLFLGATHLTMLLVDVSLVF